jgi:tetratricopeptide (TPR) repeat protein
MKKYARAYLFIILIISCSRFLYGQSNSLIDSLKSELLKTKSDTTKIRLLVAMADKYSKFDTKSALLFIEQAKKISEHINDQTYKADILFQEGNIFQISADYPKALERLDKALSVYKQLNITSKIAGCYLKIGSLYEETIEDSKALSFYSEAMNLYKHLNDRYGLSRSYQLMALVYFDQRKFKGAVDYTKKAITLADKNNKHRMAKLYLNLLLFYEGAEEYNKALLLADSIFPALKEVNDFDNLGKAYLNLSILYTDIKDYKKAKESILNAIYYDSKLENPFNYMYANIILAQIYSNTDQIDSTISVLKKTLELNKQVNNIRIYYFAYLDIYEAYEKQGNIRLAFEYFKKYTTFNDSIVKEINNKKLLELQTQYEVGLKNEQIKLLVKDKQLAGQKILILGISLLAILIACLFIIVYKHRKAKEKQLTYELEIKEAAYKIGTKHRELTYKAIHISQQEQMLTHIKEQLEDFRTDNTRVKESVLELLSGINRQMKQNSLEDFEKYFIEVHPEFYNNLNEKFAGLTQNELRICALLKLNLKSKQIADITGKSVRSIETTRTEIRKKMGLALQDNLFEVISKI